MDNAMTEGGQMLFQSRDLEEENRFLRVEIERLKMILATHGLFAASAPVNYADTTPPVVLKQPEDRQERAKQRIAIFRSLFRGREDVYEPVSVSSGDDQQFTLDPAGRN
jgi:hypothetical protein